MRSRSARTLIDLRREYRRSDPLLVHDGEILICALDRVPVSPCAIHIEDFSPASSESGRAGPSELPNVCQSHLAALFGDLRAASSAAAFSACFSARVLCALGFLVSCDSFVALGFSLGWA